MSVYQPLSLRISFPYTYTNKSMSGGALRGGGVPVRTEPSQQLLDDCTHNRNSKKKVGKPTLYFFLYVDSYLDSNALQSYLKCIEFSK